MFYDIYFIKISFHTNYNCNKISPPRAMMQREKIYLPEIDIVVSTVMLMETKSIV